jgi:hypothetical protein
MMNIKENLTRPIGLSTCSILVGKEVLFHDNGSIGIGVANLSIHQNLNPVTHNSFTLTTPTLRDFAKPRVHERVKISLGTDSKSLNAIATGTIATHKSTLTTTRITGYGTTYPLLHTFFNHTYENKTAGEIIQDLASQANLKFATLQDGIHFPAYVIDDRRSVLHHMHDIAALCGFDLYTNPEGQLVFEKFTGGHTIHTFDYGQHILDLEWLHTPPVATQVEAWGESPTGSQGEAAWSWLTKDFSEAKGSAGEAGKTQLLERPVLRTAEAASAAASAALATIQARTLRGRLLTTGRPEVKLGDAIRLQGLADDRLNTTFQVRSITHRLNRRYGFTTTIEFRSIP